MKKLKKIGEISIIVIMFIAIIIFHYNYRLNIRKQPSSEKWGKETVVSSRKVTTQVKAIKIDEKYVVTHNDGGKIKLTIIDVFEGILYSFANLLIIAMTWIAPSLAIVSILSFVQYKFSEKIKVRLYLIVCMACLILKALYIKISVYPENSYYFPEFMASIISVMSICIGISLITYLFSYIKFKKDSSTTAISALMPAVFIDSLLTLMVFIPFIPHF